MLINFLKKITGEEARGKQWGGLSPLYTAGVYTHTTDKNAELPLPTIVHLSFYPSVKIPVNARWRTKPLNTLWLWLYVIFSSFIRSLLISIYSLLLSTVLLSINIQLISSYMSLLFLTFRQYFSWGRVPITLVSHWAPRDVMCNVSNQTIHNTKQEWIGLGVFMFE